MLSVIKCELLCPVQNGFEENIECLPTCFDLDRSSSGHQGIPKIIKLCISLKVETCRQKIYNKN
jgi:hypothetical protein